MVQTKEGFKIRFNKNRIVFLSILCLIVLSILFIYLYTPKSIRSVNYNGQILNFRVDLREADKIPVRPDEQSLYTEFMNPSIENITIAFKSASAEENSYYMLEVIEIVLKLSVGYSTLNISPNFNRDPIIVDSYEDLSGTSEDPVIALVHPVYSNETGILLKNHVIFIEAKNYRDFDLATVKFLMVALGIKI